MYESIIENKEWLFSGIAVPFVYFLYKKIFSISSVIPVCPIEDKNIENTNTNTNTVTVNLGNEISQCTDEKKDIKYNSIEEAQNSVNILFIDDDIKFKVISILKSAGWKNTKIVKDINNLDSLEVKNTDIFFVDIQGVGKKLSFQDEGLGLADALKTKYCNKIIVIYSAENSGDRFHKALQNADDALSKNADPYEFQQIIENNFIKE